MRYANESIYHNKLKEIGSNILIGKGYVVSIECLKNGKVIDVIGTNGFENVLVECVVVQKLNEVYEKLSKLKCENTRLIILRYYKKKESKINENNQQNFTEKNRIYRSSTGNGANTMVKVIQSFYKYVERWFYNMFYNVKQISLFCKTNVKQSPCAIKGFINPLPMEHMEKKSGGCIPENFVKRLSNVTQKIAIHTP